MAEKIRIIGVDPGSRCTGYGIIDSNGFQHEYITSGYIRLSTDELPDRLGEIFNKLNDLITSWQPGTMGIEQVFVNKNVDSALKLGQARGAAICSGVQANLTVGEYTPRAIKKAVTGVGSADKQQIQQMMKLLLKLDFVPQSDEADALAIAICHANHMHVKSQLKSQVKSQAKSAGFSSKVRGGRWR